MKEAYTSPEARLSCFAPAEQLANIIEFDDLLSLSGAKPAVTPSDGDINIDTQS